MSNHVPTFIVAQENRMSNSLRALLLSIPGIEIANQLVNASSALKAINGLGTPTLIVLDTNLPDGDVKKVLEAFKAEPSRVKCIVLVNNTQEKKMVEAMGAASALLKGFSAAELWTAVKGLLLEFGDEVCQ